MTTNNTATLLIHCEDQKGIVSHLSDFIFNNHGNIIDLDQHVERQLGVFFMRIKWDLDGFLIPKEKIGDFFDTQIGRKYGMKWKLYFSDHQPRMAIFVSKQDHCLFDMLARWKAGEWAVEIPLIISNHEDLKPVADQFNIPFYHFPVTKANKRDQEEEELKLLKANQVDFIVLARYMQIVSPYLIDAYQNKIINIHHSFLPAFAGAKPYHSAFNRGVKIIGATSHYATEELDAGPIITQDVVHVSHRDSVDDLVRKGRDLEKIVLARAIYEHLDRKILVYENKTVIFQ